MSNQVKKNPTLYQKIARAISQVVVEHEESVTHYDVASCLFTLVSRICAEHLSPSVGGLMVANHLVLITDGEQEKIEKFCQYALTAYEQVQADKAQAALAGAFTSLSSYKNRNESNSNN